MAPGKHVTVPPFKDFMQLAHNTKFLTFCQMVDGANPRIVIDRASMNQEWFGAICKLFVDYDAQIKATVSDEEERKGILMEALMQVKGDASMNVDLYWRDKAIRTNTPQLMEKCEYPWETIIELFTQSSGLCDDAWLISHLDPNYRGEGTSTYNSFINLPRPNYNKDVTDLERLIEQQRLFFQSKRKIHEDNAMENLMGSLTVGGDGSTDKGGAKLDAMVNDEGNAGRWWNS